MDFPDPGIAMRSCARHRGLEDVSHRMSFVLEEGSGGMVLGLLVLAVSDPNGHTEDHLMTVAPVTGGVHLEFSIAMEPASDRWHWFLFESRWALAHSQCM